IRILVNVEKIRVRWEHTKPLQRRSSSVGELERDLVLLLVQLLELAWHREEERNATVLQDIGPSVVLVRWRAVVAVGVRAARRRRPELLPGGGAPALALLLDKRAGERWSAPFVHTERRRLHRSA